MRLHYDKTLSSDPTPLVLHGPDRVRVEIHIRQDPDGSATLLAFSGGDNAAEPEKTIQQGPFQRSDQAVAARRAIVSQLKDGGFTTSERQYPLWSMAVQRSINATRKQKEASKLDYRFDPKDVYLDW